MLGGWLGGRKGGLKGMWLLCGLRMVWTEGLEQARMPDKQSTLLAAPPPIGPLDLCPPPTMRRFRTFILKCLQDCVHDNTPLAASPAERATTVLSEHLASGSSRARWVSNRW